MEGIRVPSDSIIPPGIVGLRSRRLAVLQVRRRSRQGRSGQGRLSRRQGPARDRPLSFNSGAGHEDDHGSGPGRPQSHRHQRQDRLDRMGRLSATSCRTSEYQIGRLGWIADYPIIDNFLYPIFYSTEQQQLQRLRDPAIDKAIIDARQITDGDRSRQGVPGDRQDHRRRLLRPSRSWPTATAESGSDRVHNLTTARMGLLDFAELLDRPASSSGS